jgi:hypothetical protein
VALSSYPKTAGAPGCACERRSDTENANRTMQCLKRTSTPHSARTTIPAVPYRDRGRRRNRLLGRHHDRHEHGCCVHRQRQLACRAALRQGKEMLRADLATSDTTAPGANDSATIRPLSALLHRRRRPTPLRISTRPRGAEASTIWSTIYANRCRQQVRIFRTMPLAARWGKDTAYTASTNLMPLGLGSR